MSDFQGNINRMKGEIEKIRISKRQRLREMDFIILDNSLRESTVGQLKSHTLENKKAIYAQVKRCELNYIIVASFAQTPRVDDTFCQWLKDEGEDFSKLVSFSEISTGIRNGVYDTERIPSGLKKNKEYGLYNTFFEFDLMDTSCEWGTKWTIMDTCQLIEKRMKWVYENINSKARMLLNFRDFPMAMSKAPERVLSVVKFLAQMPPEVRMFSLAFEDPMGEYLPEELEAWTACIREVMNENGWVDGKILVHIHQKWDLQTASQMDCLSGGADGVWASLCDEGAAMGHASSTITLLNLIRLGNTKVLEKYNCTEVRKAAIEVTRLTTGKPPHPKQVVYGERALDLVFGFIGVGKFNLGDFFGEPTVNRITTLASPQMIRDRLVNLFGENEQFTLELAGKMKLQMIEDLSANIKEEYMSRYGIMMLFSRAGGQPTEEMVKEIHEVETKNAAHRELIKEVRFLWDDWNSDDTESQKPPGGDSMEFDLFYDSFMAPYFGCYRCVDSKKALMTLDMNHDGDVDWTEFLYFIKWALNTYPHTATADDLLSVVFEKGLMPLVREYKMNNPDDHEGFRNMK